MKSEAQQHTTDDQFLRRMFDTLYDITPDKFVNFYRRIPKNIKRMILSMIVSAILIVIVFQLAQIGVEKVEWANRTPLNERVIAPYNVEGRTAPPLDISLFPDHEFIMIDGAALEAERAAAVEEVRAEAMLVAEEAYEAAMAELEAQNPAAVAEPADVVEEAAAVEGADAANAEGAEGAEAVPVEEPVVLTIEDFMPAIDEEGIRAAIQPEVDDAYFLLMPNFLDYTRTYVYDNVELHPVMNCMTGSAAATPDAETGELTLPCGLAAAPAFAEGADYVNADGAMVRIMAMKYESAEEAQEAMKDFQRYSQRLGGMGNYAITNIRPVSYFFAMTNKWRVYTWSSGEWIYSVSTDTLLRLESIVRGFPY